jgi:hypothetical protein
VIRHLSSGVDTSPLKVCCSYHCNVTGVLKVMEMVVTVEPGDGCDVVADLVLDCLINSDFNVDRCGSDKLG